MELSKTTTLFIVLCGCAALVQAQGFTTTATRDDWEEINFEFNSSILSDGYPSLLRLAELLHNHPDYKVKVEGNTDSIGSLRYNEKLARARAETVRGFLVKYGTNTGQISVVGYGKTQPKVSNQTKEGRFINRRVQMTVTDGQGRIVSAGGVSDAIKALQAAEAAAKKQEQCCAEILKRLDKLDDILAAVKDLRAENARLKQDIADLQQAQAGLQKQIQGLPKPPERAELSQMMESTAQKAIEQAKPSRFALLGLNVGPVLNDVFREEFPTGLRRDIKSAGKGNMTFTGKGRYFAPFGKTEAHALQAEGEYLYYRDRQEGQFDVGLLNRWKNVQAGLFNSMKHVNIRDLAGGGTMGQGALTVDYLFPRGRIGLFGTKGYLNDRVINRRPFIDARGVTNFNLIEESFLRIVDQIGGSTEVGVWNDAYIDANFGALFRRGGTNRPGGMLRLVQPINSMWAFTVEAGLNETMVGRTNTGRIVIGLQFGNWVKPKQFTELKHPVPADIPRLRYELLTRTVRTGNSAPVADAGADQIGVAAGTITLDGSASYDPEGDPLTYEWTQIAGPSAALSAPSAAKTTFTAAEGQTYAFRLTVRDPQGAQGTAKVTVTTQAAPKIRIVRFTANPTQITAGQTTTLAWQVENADTVEITDLGRVNPQAGTATVAPTTTTTYRLTARNRTGELNEAVTVVVIQPEVRILFFQANPTSITAGQASVLTWQTQNASEVTISSVGPVAQSGSTSVTPASTTTYTLTARNRDQQETATVTIQVTAPAGPTIALFTATPPEITEGGKSTLAWQVLNATEVTISGIGKVNSTGAQDVSPAATTTYTLTATNAGGQVTATATVTVKPATPGPGPSGAVKCTSFSASPTTITAGEPVFLTWDCVNATQIVIANAGSVNPSSGLTKVYPAVDTTYTLTAYGTGGPVSLPPVTVKVTGQFQGVIKKAPAAPQTRQSKR